MEPLASPPDPSFNFNDMLGDFIPLVDPSPLPTKDFLPSTNALALIDRFGRKRSTLVVHCLILLDIDKGVEMLADDAADNGDGGVSNGATNAIL